MLPHVPIRQWVLTVPVRVRYQLAFDAALTRSVLRVFIRTVFGWLITLPEAGAEPLNEAGKRVKYLCIVGQV